MNRKLIVALIAGWVSLAGVALWAQARREVPGVMAGQPYGEIISGADIGFQRVAGQIAGQADTGKVVGRMMVRINGQWYEAQSPIGIVKGGN